MKFWKKMVLFVITTISIILSCSRYYIVKNNFVNSIANSSKQNTNQHILEKYMLESEIVKKIQEGEEITDSKIIQYLKSLSTYTIETLDIRSILSEESDIYCFREINDKHYMLISSNWSINGKVIFIINAYDVDSIYKEKDRQLRDILRTDIVILIISITVISIFSILLTKPIDSLNKITKKIAAGKFNERANIQTKDEVGELASSFNIMAEQIENKINELNLQVKQKNDFINRIYS